MPIRIRCRDKLLYRQQLFDNKLFITHSASFFQGMTYGQESKILHVMRINQIIVISLYEIIIARMA